MVLAMMWLGICWIGMLETTYYVLRGSSGFWSTASHVVWLGLAISSFVTRGACVLCTCLAYVISFSYYIYIYITYVISFSYYIYIYITYVISFSYYIYIYHICDQFLLLYIYIYHICDQFLLLYIYISHM